MFEKTRLRLLLIYLAIFGSILGIFAIAVRVVFVHAMTNQIIDKLTILGKTVAASSEFKNGHLQVEDNFSERELDIREQSLQWFDAQGNMMLIQGKLIKENIPPAIAFSRTESVQFLKGKTQLISVRIPLVTEYNNQLIGYIIVSQSLEELHKTYEKLDIGLAGGIAIALVFVGIGGIMFTRQAMQPIEQGFDRLQQFTADASHELRNPLMAIKASSQVALRHPAGMRDCDREEFQAISLSADRMARMTEDLLLLARMDKKLHERMESIDLTELLQSLFQQFQSSAASKELDFSYQYSKTLFIKGNSEQIWRLFTNLIENAIHYTNFGGKVSIEVNQSGQSSLVHIRDTGIGIAAEQIDNIFSRFWRADSSRHQWAGGAGLGLAIAQSIAEIHGGKIQVVSQLGKGSCFTVKLPLSHTG
ncbi:MAG: ATP-binding protein [Pseudanabaenaceae cyanobacterium bins.39]|nr:ATP-binding protein [Pseudanabaenaceae cyanobacterium bins.39]